MDEAEGVPKVVAYLNLVDLRVRVEGNGFVCPRRVNAAAPQLCVSEGLRREMKSERMRGRERKVGIERERERERERRENRNSELADFFLRCVDKDELPTKRVSGHSKANKCQNNQPSSLSPSLSTWGRFGGGCFSSNARRSGLRS